MLKHVSSVNIILIRIAKRAFCETRKGLQCSELCDCMWVTRLLNVGYNAIEGGLQCYWMWVTMLLKVGYKAI